MKKTLFVAWLSLFSPLMASAALEGTDVMAATKVKRNVYMADITVTGGDALANPVTLSAVRWADNKIFERIVVDLSGEGSGWETKIPPYFIVGASSREHKISLSIRGVAARKLTQDTLAKALSKSRVVSSSYLGPGLEGDLASLEFLTHGPAEIESFYLTSPPRIVIDVRAKH